MNISIVKPEPSLGCYKHQVLLMGPILPCHLHSPTEKRIYGPNRYTTEYNHKQNHLKSNHIFMHEVIPEVCYETIQWQEWGVSWSIIEIILVMLVNVKAR
jgi:hypothetical protein